MGRILYSQSEKINNPNDYFVIDGNLIDESLAKVRSDAFQKITEAENWKDVGRDNNLTVKKKENHFYVKSLFLEKDELSRSLFYVYIIEANSVTDVFENLKKDAKILNKTIEINFSMINKFEKKHSSIKGYVVVLMILFIIITLVWKTI